MTPQYLSPIVYDGTVLESRRLDPANLPWTPASNEPVSLAEVPADITLSDDQRRELLNILGGWSERRLRKRSVILHPISTKRG